MPAQQKSSHVDAEAVGDARLCTCSLYKSFQRSWHQPQNCKGRITSAGITPPTSYASARPRPAFCQTAGRRRNLPRSTQHAAKQNADLSQISFTVQLAATEPKLRVFQGQFKGHNIRTRVIWLKDLCQLCELSLHTSLFSHMKKVVKQQRGSAIGYQISPSLANSTVSYLEHQWFQKLASIWQNRSRKSFLQISSSHQWSVS